MRSSLSSAIIFFASSIVFAQSGSAAPYCPNPAHARPEKPPPDLAAAVAKAFQIDAAAMENVAFVRCLGAKLMGCYVGANLVCDKADRRRVLPGASAWCRDNPGSPEVPMAATGHGTIYEWSCQGTRAVAGKATVTLDRQGYIADNWKEIP
jgi:hypothetical protein